MKFKWRRRRKHSEKHAVSDEEVNYRECIRKEVEQTNRRMLGQLYELEASIFDPHWREKHQ